MDPKKQNFGGSEWLPYIFKVIEWVIQLVDDIREKKKKKKEDKEDEDK